MSQSCWPYSKQDAQVHSLHHSTTDSLWSQYHYLCGIYFSYKLIAYLNQFSNFFFWKGVSGFILSIFSSFIPLVNEKVISISVATFAAAIFLLFIVSGFLQSGTWFLLFHLSNYSISYRIWLNLVILLIICTTSLFFFIFASSSLKIPVVIENNKWGMLVMAFNSIFTILVILISAELPIKAAINYLLLLIAYI